MKDQSIFKKPNEYRQKAKRKCMHGDEDLKATVEMKENYIRMTKGRANRVGHNWEAVAEWFIDKFTTGAPFLDPEPQRQRH